MIDPTLYLAFVAATTVLMLIPGPNIALIVANSVAYGPRYGLLTVAGTSSAMIVQLAVAAFGLTQALGTLGLWLEWLRWIGVAYLIYLGVTHWRAPVADLTKTAPEPKSARAIYTRALLVSLTNPKLLLFYGAFFPQFVSVGKPVGMQIAALSGTFVALAVALDGSWALIAGRARKLLVSHGRLRNRITGGLLIAAGTVLGIARPTR
jgi:threonine/homoserine/homoserine lactone efflux protein